MRHDRLRLADIRQAKDLATFLSRVKTIEATAAVRLQARGRSLAVWAPVMSAETLLDTVPTVLGMRALHLAHQAEADATVEASAVLDRLARIESTDGELSIPPATVTAAWAGVMPPTRGWTEQGRLDAESIERIARDGIRAVESALPVNPGNAVLSTVRSRIWGEESEDGVVSGAMFGATVLGFNETAEGFTVYANGPWRRLSNSRGHIVAKPATAL
ncbi:hypothetical protein [Curtobacterium sp. S6]|uniref:hypothetical protein n=1 Tax=Curtobacterium sp. S6 TaxID=1479623 RepID=UPI0004AB869F|nr:hypothetical protein [Curtobacterium sp. S6]